MEEVRHKDYMLYVSIYRNFLEKVKLESRSVVAWGLWWLGKGLGQVLEVIENIIYLDCNGSYTSVYICSNSSN